MPNRRDEHPERRAAEIVQARTGSDPHFSSLDLGWRWIAVQRVRLSPTRFSLPALEAHLIAVHLQGAPAVTCRTATDTCRNQAAAWDATILPAGTTSDWRFDGDCELLHVYLDPRLIERAAAEIEAAKSEPVNVATAFLVRDPILTRMAEELLIEVQAPGLATRFFAGSSARLLALHLLRSYSNRADLVDSGPYVISPAKLRRALAYIDDNLDSQISITAIAEVVGMTLYHFAKTFKLATGRSPYRYVTERRIELAKRLLMETDLEIAQIAHRVGLSSQSYFTALFARHTGLTPKRYRDLMRG